MFERYTEPARRVVFFARYEASKFGSAKIEPEHVLLGLIREDEKGFQRFLPSSVTIEAMRRQVEDQLPVCDDISTTTDIPLSVECKRILGYAAEESAGLEHPHIDVSHLLLGILREENCIAAQILRGLGLELVSVREAIRRQPVPAETEPSDAMRLKVIWPGAKPPLPASGVVPNADTAKRIAEAVWTPRTSAITGGPIAAQIATLTSGVWIVTGSHQGKDTNTALAAFIQKEDGKILRLHVETLDS